VKTTEAQEKTKDCSNLSFSQNGPLLVMYKKNQHVYIVVHGHSSWSTFGLHIVKGPRLPLYF
jgi:hypothetical protein